MKKTLIFIILALLVAGALISCGSNNNDTDGGNNNQNQSENTTAVTPDNPGKEPIVKLPVLFDFEDDDSGFVAIFADYPEGSEVFYQLESGYKALPVPGVTGSGLYIKGNNHSDDLFMGYYKKLNGFAPGEKAILRVEFKLATNVEAGFFGIGGSPGESVAVKCGVVAVKPEAVVDGSGYYRMNIDTGAQMNSGADMQMIGNLAKKSTTEFDAYEFNLYQLDVSVQANENGELYLIIATDSGFEGVSDYYIDDVEVSLMG